MIVRISYKDIQKLFAGYIMFYFSGCLSGFIKGNSISNLILVFCIAAWFFLRIKDRKYIGALLLTTYPLLLFIVYMLFVQLQLSSAGRTATKHDLIIYIYIWVLAAIGIFYAGAEQRSSNKFLLKFWTIDVSAACLWTAYRLKENPLAARYLSRGEGDAISQQYLSGIDIRGIISYPVVYGVIMIIAVYVFILVEERKIEWKIAIPLICCTIGILSAQFMMALLFMVVAIVSACVFPKLKGKNVAIYIIIAAIACMALLYLAPALITWVRKSGFFSSAINMRLDEIVYFLNGNGIAAGSDMGARLQLYGQSVEAFMKNYGLGGVLLDKAYGGGHSELLDLFANYGLIGGVLVVSFVVKYYKYCKKKIAAKYRPAFMLAYILFSALSIVNTVLFAPTAVIMLIIIPLLLIERSKEYCEE